MGSPSGEVLGGRVPESAFSTERLCKRVPFRESTRGESVRGGVRVSFTDRPAPLLDPSWS